MTTLLAESSPGQPVMRRLHPMTPFVRGWKIIAGFLAYGSSQSFGAVAGGDRDAPSGTQTAAAFGLFLGLVVVALLIAWVSWRSTRYGLDGVDLRIDTGVVRRQSRRVRLDRVQAVDVVRPLLARVLGLAELRLEVAGGASTEAPLAYLSESEAQALRAELLARAAGLRSDTPEAPERLLHTVGAPRLLVSTLLQLPVVVGAVAAVVLAGVAVSQGEPGALLFIFPAAASVVPAFARQFAANYGFTLAESPDGLRIRRGLLETRAQTVPPGRVQAVRLSEPLLWRVFAGWARLEVEIAGYSATGPAGAEAAVLLPVAPRAQCLALLARVLPGADPTTVATTGVPRRARWLAPLSRRVLAAGGGERYFVARRGAFRRITDVMPHERIQSVRVHQHPLQRWLRLASVTLDTTPGPVTVVAAHRDAADALTLAHQQARRARSARRLAVGQEWMRPRYTPGPDGGVTGGAADAEPNDGADC